MLREANFADVPAIVELALESVGQVPWAVTPSRRLIRKSAELAVEQGCVWVSETDKINGVVGGIKHPSVWFSEFQVSLALFYCRSGHEGYKLLKRFADWVKAQEDVGAAIVTLEPYMDEKYVRAFKRLGFDAQSVTLSYVRGTK